METIMSEFCNAMPKLSRRNVFRAGLATVSGYYLDNAARPLNVYASSPNKLRGAADFCVFLFLNGGASQLDTFDLKEGRWTPPDFDVRTIRPGFVLPYGLFPKISQQLDHLAFVRSVEAWESAHARAQYYMQVGHSFSPARRKEMPAVGAVIASELASRRKEGDFLPPFVAMNFDSSQAGLVREGCLPSHFGPLPLDTQQGNEFVIPAVERLTFDRRWNLLQRLSGATLDGSPARGGLHTEFDTYTKGAQGMMTSPRIAEALALPEADRTKYGSSPLGDACVLARNLVTFDAGARHILISHNGWDLHANMYDPKGKNHYVLCRELDNALSALLTDLRQKKGPDGRTFLERTFIVCVGEFGRTGGGLTINKGRDHNRFASTALFAGAGVKGAQILGKTDEKGEKVIETGWGEKRAIYTEDIVATIYSQLGIDWSKRIKNTPSGREFEYLEPMSGTDFVMFKEISPLFS